MNVVEIVAVVVASITMLSKYVGLTKELWSKIPAVAHYVPGALVVLTLVGEKLAGVKDTNDLVAAGFALALLGYGHFTKPKK